jgi:opacity protein-like surface antigen
MIYGLGGYTWAKTSAAELSLAGITLATLPVGDLNGWTLGAGLERDVGGGFTISAEYRSTWLEKANLTLAPGANVGLGGQAHSIRAGLSYRF